MDNNYYMNPANEMIDYADKIETMYPENYTKIYPHVQDIVDTLDNERMYALTPMDIDGITEQVVKQSNPHRDENFAKEMARVLILRELFHRHDRNSAFPFIFPFFFNPFGRNGHMRGHRGRFGRH